jgi:WD40 repeat protein
VVSSPRDAATGQEVLTLKDHTARVSSVCFSPDGNRILSGSSDSTVKIWDADKVEELLTLKANAAGVTSVCFSPDGKRFLSCAGDSVKVWDASFQD